MKFTKSDPIEITEHEAEQMPLPLDLFEPSREVRPEYNIGKFAGVIFMSPYAKNVRETRTYSWQIKNGDDQVDASLTVTPLQGQKTPTTTTLRIYLALIQVWEHMGKPEDGVVTFSARQLAAVIGWRWGGAETATRIYDHLKVLSGTSLSWVLAYQNASGEMDELYSDMSILSSADYRKRNTLFEPQKFETMQRIRFNPDLVENMIAGHVRPLNYKAFRQIANDTTANLYTRIDLYLAKKTKWERRATGLLYDELGLGGRRYEKRFNRHAKLKEFVRDLDGVELFNGKLSLSIEKTADGADYKLVARKEPRIQPKKRYLKPVNDQEYAEILADDVIAEIKRQPRAGSPKRNFIVFLCALYPESVVRDALSIAKGDYQGKVKKTLSHVFVAELKRAVTDRKLKWYK